MIAAPACRQNQPLANPSLTQQKEHSMTDPQDPLRQELEE
ncbi:MAG TPA: AAA family ATPase, partial [Aeromonas salmonicida]|nr:AAA family ATPase [Aeromonas salmonicida]